MSTSPLNEGDLNAAELRLDDALASQIAHVRELPPREAAYAQTRYPMHPALTDRLEQIGIEDLFSHQAHAYDEAMRGSDIVVVTGTNSGKTMCYNLPALQMALSEPAARMLYLFPTKALAQDQLGKLEELMPPGMVRAGTYDGDTPPSQRGSLRKLAHIILTNPDMLHIGILPGHELWSKFFKSLRLIVLDEMHAYRGVFGSHVACILRRLLRLCEWHNSSPRIIACSATIGNPLDLFSDLTGRTARLIDEDGSPKGKRTFVFWNPPFVGEGQRMSSNVAASELMVGMAERNQRTLTFSRARISAELVLRYARKRAEKGSVRPESIESYRAGYTPKERRQIEKLLFRGDLLALSATNAMELGVDVGTLDCVIMNGYPGTVASFWQQAGRAGRGTKDGLAIMVAHDDPLEQFLIREPGMVLDATNERVAINPSNPQILSQQLRCAAHERPLSPSELENFGTHALEVAESLDRSGELRFQAGRFFYPSHEPPAPGVNIRGSGGEQITLHVDGEALGTMERWRAMTSSHEGAVYLHRGQSFVVDKLDLDAKMAHVTAREVDYYTQAIVQSVVDPKFILESGEYGKGKVSLVGITVTDMVNGFRKKSLDGDTVLSVEPLDLPPSTYDTLAVRFDLPVFEGEEGVAGVHGLEHALMALAPLLAGTDRGDLGSSWYAMFPDTFAPCVFVFDRTPGGVGFAERLYDSASGWIVGATQLLKSCDCEGGCPACLYSPRCEANNESLSKEQAVKLLQLLQ